MLIPITQEKSDAWDAQPGTDVFGGAWASWERSIITDHQADLIAAQAAMLAARPNRKVRQETTVSAAQMELAL